MSTAPKSPLPLQSKTNSITIAKTIQFSKVYDSLPPHSAWNQQSPLSRKLAKEGRLVAIIRYDTVIIRYQMSMILAKDQTFYWIFLPLPLVILMWSQL